MSVYPTLQDTYVYKSKDDKNINIEFDPITCTSLVTCAETDTEEVRFIDSDKNNIYFEVVSATKKYKVTFDLTSTTQFHIVYSRIINEGATRTYIYSQSKVKNVIPYEAKIDEDLTKKLNKGFKIVYGESGQLKLPELKFVPASRLVDPDGTETD